MFTNLEQIILSWAEEVPLWFFAFTASFIEELVPPIPSPSIMIITGFLASVQDYAIFTLILFSIISATGKTLGALIVYFIVDKVEDILTGRFGKFIGLKHEEIEAFGARLGRGLRDYFILIILRALPIVPSTFVSVGSGILKIRLKLFLISTFIGSIIRSFIYIYVGYIGTDFALSFLHNTEPAESVVSLILILLIILILGFLYFRRKKVI